jgi:hypothetical protein
MESKSHDLDCSWPRFPEEKLETPRSIYLEYSRKVHRIAQLEEEREKKDEYVTRLDSMCTIIVFRFGEAAQQTPLLNDLRAEAVSSHLESLVCHV